MKGFGLRPILIASCVAALLAAGSSAPAREALRAVLSWTAGLGALGPVVFAAAYVLATVLFVPGSLLTLGAGALFGVLWGTVTVSAASTTGAAAAFLLGRYAARGWVLRRIEQSPRLKALDKAVGGQTFKIVALLRLSPAFPFNLLNYAMGATRADFLGYLGASWAGMLPGTLMYVSLGSAAGGLARLGAGGGAKSPAEWALFAVGLAATVAVTLYVTRLARAELERATTLLKEERSDA